MSQRKLRTRPRLAILAATILVAAPFLITGMTYLTMAFAQAITTHFGLPLAKDTLGLFGFLGGASGFCAIYLLFLLIAGET